MGWTAGAKRVWRVQSKALNAPTHWFTPCCLRAKRSSANVGGSVIREGEADQWAAGMVGGADRRRKSVPMERRFWNGFPKKRADVSLKSQKSSRSIRFTAAFRKNYAASTASASRPTKLTRPAITKYCL